MQIKRIKTKEKVIFLLDMDAFFASCHVARDPSLKDKNLVVASPNRRAIITTASYNARKFGIKAGMPIFKAEELCKNIYRVDSDFALYIKYSQMVFDVIYKNFSQKIEVASIDECYIDVTHVWKKYGTAKKCAIVLKNMVYEKTGLTCSIGISSNKFLAKSCVDFNKPNGVSILLPKDIDKVLWPLEVKEMFMVGKATEEVFLKNNIFTIKDLAQSDVNKIYELLGKRGLTLWSWANGYGSDIVEKDENEFKSIGNEFTLNYTTTDTKEIEEMIYELSLKICDRANKRFLKGKTISIILKYENEKNYNFNATEHKKHKHHQAGLEQYTAEVEKVYSVAKNCFYNTWTGEPILLIGVRLSNLIDDINDKKQLSLGDVNLYERTNLNDIQKIIYDLELKFGTKKIFTGDKLIKYNKKNRGQSKYLENDDVHISNKQVVAKWSKEKKD
ncbi:Y-family DNA polymerase [Spiroplasma tabanidicola]|uniref:DNA polymerase IV n=1 Tax=Spiroplasma tabanidicola TaxID=324079 RepID=A0A6I6C6X6_9MOLU|nr:DNA polymerase IV [Spiroplasma tabanidicola]QGS51950.1 DNA polymerase IV [Spiroplasma tabanidicola]